MSRRLVHTAGETDLGQPPVIALLELAKSAFVDEFDRRLAASDFPHLSLAHSKNVLRYLTGGPLRASQVTECCGVSKQAVSQQIVHLEKNGYLVVTPDPTDQRARLLSLTEEGLRAQRLVVQTFRDIEQEWAEAYGADDLAIARRLLLAVGTRGASCEPPTT